MNQLEYDSTDSSFFQASRVAYLDYSSLGKSEFIITKWISVSSSRINSTNSSILMIILWE